jgi:hypothetical protein
LPGQIIASKSTILAERARSARQAAVSPTSGQWLAVALFAISWLAAFGLVANTAPELAPVEVIRLDLPKAEFAVVPADDAGFWREDRVRRGDTIGSVLARMGVDDPEALQFSAPTLRRARSISSVPASR